MKCKFIQHEPGVVRCSECGLKVRTAHPPEVVNANCLRQWSGVGSWIAWKLSTRGIASCSACWDLADEMDRHGPEYCKDHAIYYAESMMKNAEKHGSLKIRIASKLIPYRLQLAECVTLIIDAVAAVNSKQEKSAHGR